MRKRRSRAGEWARYVMACVAILLVAWGLAMVVVMAFTTAWVNEPDRELTEAQMEIITETLEQLKGE